MTGNMLVVVDYQVDFVNGALGFDGAEKLDAGISRKVREAAARGDSIVVTRDTHHENYLQTREGKSLPVEHCIFGQPGWELYGETANVISVLLDTNYPDLILLDKETFGVSPQMMAAVLARYEISRVEFVGLVTNMCVMANVCCFQACFPNAQMAVDSSLCSSFDRELHIKTLDVLRGMQVEIC